MKLEPATSPTSVPDRPSGHRYRFVVTWHAALAVFFVVALIGAITGPGADLVGPFRHILVGLSAFGMIANIFVVAPLHRHRDMGRTVSIMVNYLTIVVSAAVLLSRVGVFEGFDELATRFEGAIYWLLVPFVGWLWMLFSDRIGQPHLRRGGTWMVRGGAVVFIFAMGIIDGVVAIAGELVDVRSLVLVALIAGAAYAMRVMWGARARNDYGTTSWRQEQIEGLLFLSPNVLGFLFFFAGPLVFSLFISFWDWDALGDKSFVGFDNYFDLFRVDIAFMESSTAPASEALKTNYAEAFRFNLFGQNILISAIDRAFWQSLRNIVIFLAVAVPASVIPGLVVANLLNSKLPGMKFFRAVLFIPSIAGVIGISLIWRQLFNASVGWLNYLLTVFLPGDYEIRWLTDQSTALFAIAIVFAWMTFGFNSVLFVAGLQGIPVGLYEAARLDGASSWQQFRYITLPMLKPTTFFVVAITTINSIQMFEIVFVLMTPPEGPGNSTLTPVLYLYQQGFQNFSQGYASAVSWVLFGFIFCITLVQFKRNKSNGTEAMA